MARYYLGKLEGTRYVPISIGLCDTTIDSVMWFTESFENETELREFLTKREIIDGNEPLSYIKEEKDTYKALYNGNFLSYKASDKYSNLTGLEATLKEEKYNLELFTDLYNCISNKFVHINSIPAEKRNITSIKNELDYAYNIGLDNYKYTRDKNNLDVMIHNFVISATGRWNEKTKSYDFQVKKLADLVLFLNKYYEIKKREMLRREEIEALKNLKEELEDLEEKEEFLTADDFIQCGMDPEENKKLIRDKNL